MMKAAIASHVRAVAATIILAGAARELPERRESIERAHILPLRQERRCFCRRNLCGCGEAQVGGHGLRRGRIPAAGRYEAGAS